jgi:AcrR family transcriptional regulator
MPPPGRHGLSRSFVAKNQRDRILAAVADVSSAASYGELTVEAVIVHARVSRRTFYEHFTNKEEAFLAAYDAVLAQLFERVSTRIEEEESFVARVAAGLGAFLEFLSNEPAFARMCIIEVLAAGSDAIARRNGALRLFAALIEDNANRLVEGPQPPALTAETVVGGVYEVIYTRILRDEIRKLPGAAAGPHLLRARPLPRPGDGARRAGAAGTGTAGRIDGCTNPSPGILYTGRKTHARTARSMQSWNPRSTMP